MMASRCRDAEAELNLPPGFRFHPTDEELVVHYLCRKAAHQCLPVPIIAEVDLYKYNPWDLPDKALFGQREWYYFTPRDRKYPNGSRPNRAAGRGYWKATGADKPVSPDGNKKPLAIKKALVFYDGKAPKGIKTDWIMHEYRLADTNRSAKKGTLRLDEWVLCRLYNKKNNWDRMQRRAVTMAPAVAGVSSSSYPHLFGTAAFQDDTQSDSLRTPESDIEHDVFPDYMDGVCGRRCEAYEEDVKPVMMPVMADKVKEDSNDWFMDLNLDDLQGPIGPFSLDVTGQDYIFPALGYPQLRPGQSNLPNF